MNDKTLEKIEKQLRKNGRIWLSYKTVKDLNDAIADVEAYFYLHGIPVRITHIATERDFKLIVSMD